MNTITLIQDVDGPRGPRAVDVEVAPNTVLGFDAQGAPAAVAPTTGITPASIGAETPAGAQAKAADAVAGHDASAGAHGVGRMVQTLSIFAWPYMLSTAATGNTANFDIYHKAVTDGFGSRWTYANVHNDDVAGPSVITMRVALVNKTKSATTYYPLFFNGSRDVVLQPGAIVESDICRMEWSAGDEIQERVFITVPEGGQWPVNRNSAFANTKGNQNTTETDLTTSATHPTGSGNAQFGAVSMRSGVYSFTRELAVLGDSIAYGQGDAPATGSPDSGCGFVQRAINHAIPYRFFPTSGALISSLSGLRPCLARGASTVLVGYGTNDISAGATATQLEGYMVTAWRRFSRSGARVLQCTIPPRSTDATTFYATEAAQTPAATDSIRQAVNAWLRDGAPVDPVTFAPSASVGAIRAGSAAHPLHSIVDIAVVLEGTIPGTWRQGADQRTVVGISTASTSVTSATDQFTAADVGRQVCITGVGQGVIYSYTGPRQVSCYPPFGTNSNVSALVGTTVGGDGTHPSTAGNIAAASVIDLSVIA